MRAASVSSVLPPTQVLQLELCVFHGRLDALKALRDRDAIQLAHAEILHRTELYKLASGEAYSRPKDAELCARCALKRLFLSLQGFEWSRKEGWIGLPRTATRPACAVFEASAALWAGIGVRDGIVRDIDLSYNNCSGELGDDWEHLQDLHMLCLRGNAIGGVSTSV
jgi:hypothetical protein